LVCIYTSEVKVGSSFTNITHHAVCKSAICNFLQFYCIVTAVLLCIVKLG